MVLGNLFDAATKNGTTVLMVAHRLETAVTYCDQVLVMDDGAAVAFDTPLSLLNSGSNIFSELVSSLTENA